MSEVILPSSKSCLDREGLAKLWNKIKMNHVTGSGQQPHGNRTPEQIRQWIQQAKANIDLDKVGNFKAVSTEANQGLDSTEKENARNNIGLESKSEQESSNEVSLVTRDEKYKWNHSQGGTPHWDDN